jgi:hypothetical protein
MGRTAESDTFTGVGSSLSFHLISSADFSMHLA